jgi:hypothetical protein
MYHRLRVIAALAALTTAPLALQAQLSVLSNTVEEHIAAAGDHYSGTIIITNPGADAQAARIYQTDYQFAANGTSEFRDAGTAPRSNAGWITPQMTRVVVPAGGRVVVPYSVAVPASDSLKGTYWSAIMVEGTTLNPGKGDGKPSVEVGSVIRYAIQVATHIQMSGTRAVKFIDAGVVKGDDGEAAFDVDIHDVGERGYRPTLSLELYDETGTLRAKAKQTRGLLYPGTSLRQHFALGKLAPGSYKAVLFADTGDEAVVAAQYTIKY